MNITVIGSGYVGLVTAACFSDIGHNVCCIDMDRKKINKLKIGEIPFSEPGLDKLVHKSVSRKNLTFTTSYKQAFSKKIDSVFMCVGTPPNKNRNPDLTFLKKSIESIAKHSKGEIPIFIKSTVPAGTNKKLKKYYLKFKNLSNQLIFASNPEFLKEGDAINDFMHPDRIIIGSENTKVHAIAKEAYASIISKKSPIIFTSIESAELIKYSANAFLATKISFINEISRLSEYFNADILEIQKGIGLDSRIGKKFLSAGIGFGGSCFPKDLDGLIYNYKKSNILSSIPQSSKDANNEQLKFFYNKLNHHWPCREKNILIWGLAFKPGTDDIRESASIKLIKQLAKKANNLFLYDPEATHNSKIELKHYKNIVFLKDKYEKISLADGLIICTDWSEFKKPEIKEILKLKEKIIFDGRNILDKKILKNHNIRYYGVGR